MKYCSLCNNPYSDEVKTCALSHCISCGSTRLHLDKKSTVNPLAIIVIVGFFGMIFYALVFDKTEQISSFFIFFGILIGMVILNAYSTHSVYLCLDCLAKGFTPITKTPLQEIRVSESEKKIHTGITPEDIAKLVKPNHGFKTKLDFRAWLLIIGLVLGLIALLFGDVISDFVNSDIMN